MKDLRFAVGQLRKNLAFTATAILVLALGMAASLAMFAFVDAALLRPLPYAEPARLVGVYRSGGTCATGRCELSYQNYLDLKKQNRVFLSFEAWESASVHLWKGPNGAEALRAGRVSGGFFQTLGVRAMLGRVFHEADDKPGAERTAVLPFYVWQSRFGGQAGIVGQRIVLDDEPHVVIGVLPPDFHFALRAAEVWTTIHDQNECERERGCETVGGVGRLRDGVSVESAWANARVIAKNLEKQYPETNEGQSFSVAPLREALIGDVRPTLLVLLSGAVLLMLIASVNVASLMLVRAESRRREAAVRMALGASTWQVARLFVAEGGLLAAGGVSLGLAAAGWGIPWLFRLIPERAMRGMPYFREVGLQPAIWMFAAGSAVAAAAICALAPMMRLPGAGVHADLKEGGRGATGVLWKRFGSNMVAVELAAAMLLLGTAGLLGKSVYRLLHVELGFNAEQVATLEMDIPKGHYSKDEERIALSRRLLERVRALPGVRMAGHVSLAPLTCICGMNDVRIVGHDWDGKRQQVMERTVSVDYFRALQVRLVSGQWLSERDDAKRPAVVLVNRAFEKRFFGAGEEAIGRMIGDDDLSTGSQRRIVGVVDDVREGTLSDRIGAAIYLPFLQHPEGMAYLTVRTDGREAAAMMPGLKAVIHAVDPDIGVRNQFTMVQRIENAAFLNRSAAWLVGAFAAAALLLGVVGLYGVVAYSVSRRTSEIGVRMALGAQAGAVYRLILGEAGLVAMAGVGVGLVCSIQAGHLLRGLLFGVDGWDGPMVMAIGAGLWVCAVAGSFLPARRAARVNPVEALRAKG